MYSVIFFFFESCWTYFLTKRRNMAEGVWEQGAEEDTCNYLRRRKVAVSWRKLDNAGLMKNVIRVIKSRKMWWAKHMARVTVDKCLLEFGRESWIKRLFIVMLECNIYRFTYKWLCAHCICACPKWYEDFLSQVSEVVLFTDKLYLYSERTEHIQCRFWNAAHL